MNNKGQSLILFLLMIPIVVSFLAFFVDLSLVSYEKNRLNGIMVDNLEIIVKENIRDIEKIRGVFLENDILVNNLVIEENRIFIEFKMDIKSLFGKILDFDIYKFDLKYEGDYLEKVVSKVG